MQIQIFKVKKKIPEENASYRCLSLIMLDSIVKVKKKSYPQALLEECKYEIKRSKMEKKKVHLMSWMINLIMILMMKQSLTMR